MPRKPSYGFDYDDDYEDYGEYDDYDYDYDDHQEEKVEAAPVKQDVVKSGMWRCAICTYDNDEGMTCCEICGVLRFPPSSSGNNLDTKAIGGTCKDSGVSQLAKSLFASVPRWTPKTVIASQTQSSPDVTGGDNSHNSEIANAQRFHALPCGLIVPRTRRQITIAPFKFDVPSPDDVISNRLNSTKKGSGGAASGSADKSKGTTNQSVAKQIGRSLPVKDSRAPTEENSGPSATTVLENSDRAVGPSWSTVSATSTTRKQKSKQGDSGESSSFANGAEPENFASSMGKMSLSRNSGSSKPILPRKTLTQYKPEKWMLPEKESGGMDQLNLAIVGHVDSGKSTLSGRLLHLMGQISQKQMHKYEKEAKQQGKGSFAYAWALDESAEERERGITMTVAVAYFDTKRYHVVLLDSPGHKDFVPNLISGATQADAAVLVIDASFGAYESGIDVSGGQSREHAQLVRSFGVDQLIVAVNKMDVVAYSKERFDLIKQQVGSFLHQLGFKESSIMWIPFSAMENQNLVVAASDLRLNAWYKGSCLLDAIDSLHPPTRDYDKPPLMPICDVVKTNSVAQVSACGKLEAGALRSGFKVLVMPVGDLATVRSIECNSQSCTIARAGENVAVTLQGIEVGHVMAGGVLCHPDFPVRVASHLGLKILVLDVKIPILIGTQVECHIHHAKEAARVVKIVSLLDTKTGKETKKAPRHLVSKQSAAIEVRLQGEVCVEEFTSCKALGRVFLRQLGRTIAVGVVTQVFEDQK